MLYAASELFEYAFGIGIFTEMRHAFQNEPTVWYFFPIGLNVEPVLDVCRPPERVCARWFYMSIHMRKEF